MSDADDVFDRAHLTDLARHDFDFRRIRATLADERLKLRAYLQSCLA